MGTCGRQGLNNFAMSPHPIGVSSDDVVDAVLSTTTGVSFQPKYDRNALPEVETHPLFVYLPTAVGSFAEMKSHSDCGASHRPDDLLVSAQHRESNRVVKERRGIAYMYSNCITKREQFYSKLRAIVNEDTLPVTALGACQGIGSPSDRAKLNARTASSYIEDAISLYSEYKFVIAFENVNMTGYITEKLTNAFLAGAIPIYSGADDVDKYFSNGAMINCNSISEADCIQRVLDVSQNQSQYVDMRSTAPMNESQWSSFFAAWPWPLFGADTHPIRNKYRHLLRSILS